LDGVIDLHIHLAPDILPRSNDVIEFLESAEKVGYRAVILKDHYAISPGRAYLMRKVFKKTISFGGIALNYPTGGLNPDAVEVAIQRGAKEIWMPTFEAANHLARFSAKGLVALPRGVDRKIREVKRTGKKKEGLKILTPSGELKEEVKEILGMAADADVAIGTGHLYLNEIHMVVDEAIKAGVKKVLVTHPDSATVTIPTEDQVKMADKGAIMEHCSITGFNANITANNIKRVGAKRCILSSDGGLVQKGNPILVFKSLIENLMKEGITESEIRTMTRENPARVLGID
jgi:hypothetical protein